MAASERAERATTDPGGLPYRPFRCDAPAARTRGSYYAGLTADHRAAPPGPLWRQSAGPSPPAAVAVPGAEFGGGNDEVCWRDRASPGRHPQARDQCPPLKSQLGMTRLETAWLLLHKLRAAMVDPDRSPLSGVVEVDETWVSGTDEGSARRWQVAGDDVDHGGLLVGHGRGQSAAPG